MATRCVHPLGPVDSLCGEGTTAGGWNGVPLKRGCSTDTEGPILGLSQQ